MIAKFSYKNAKVSNIYNLDGASFLILAGIFPTLVRTVFAENCVAVVFVVAVILNLVLPKEMDIKAQ